MTDKAQHAKRGDLIDVGQTVGNFVIGQPYSERTIYTIGVVTNITRDGSIKAFRDRHENYTTCTTRLDRVTGLISVSVMPATRIDVAAAMRSAESHSWPSGHPWMPFDTLDEVRTALKPCLLMSTDAGGKGVR